MEKLKLEKELVFILFRDLCVLSLLLNPFSPPKMTISWSLLNFIACSHLHLFVYIYVYTRTHTWKTTCISFLSLGSFPSPSASLQISFFFIESYSILSMYPIFIVPSSVDGRQGWFHFLALINRAAIIRRCKFLCGRIQSSLGTCQGLVWQGYVVFLFLVFWGKSKLNIHSGCINLHSHHHCPLSSHPSQHLLWGFFMTAILTKMRWHLKGVLMTFLARSRVHI